MTTPLDTLRQVMDGGELMPARLIEWIHSSESEDGGRG